MTGLSPPEPFHKHYTNSQAKVKNPLTFRQKRSLFFVPPDNRETILCHFAQRFPLIFWNIGKFSDWIFHSTLVYFPFKCYTKNSAPFRGFEKVSYVLRRMLI